MLCLLWGNFMKEKEKELLLQYYYNKDLRLQDDIVTYENRYRVRYCDEIDHLESIISIVRKNMFNEVMLEVFQLLKVGPFERKENRRE